MIFTFLGTGTSQGIPVIGCKCEVCLSDNIRDKRLRCSLLVQSEKTTVVIDAGPDFRQQMLNNNVKDLDAIVFTHEHMDHLSGLDEIRPFNYLLKKKIPVYATERVQMRLKEQYAYIFNNPDYPGIPGIELITINDEAFSIGDIDFRPVNVMHAKLPVLGFRIEDFTYITDASYISEQEKNKIIKSKYLVLNALRKEVHHSHFNLQQAIDLADEVKAEQTYLIHLSHQMGLYNDVIKHLPSNVKVAFDGLKVKV